MSNNLKIIVVLEFRETAGESIYPVTGRNGHTHGYATLCPKRGTMCWRVPLEHYRTIKDDLFTARRHLYYPVPDVEVVQDEAETLDPTPAGSPGGEAASEAPPAAIEPPATKQGGRRKKTSAE